MSREAAGKVRQEFKKLKMMTPMSAEATVVRGYIDWLISLPWFDRKKVRQDLEEADKILVELEESLDPQNKALMIRFWRLRGIASLLKGETQQAIDDWPDAAIVCTPGVI